MVERIGRALVQRAGLRREPYILSDHRTDLPHPVHYMFHFFRDKVPHAVCEWLINRFDQSPGAQETERMYATPTVYIDEIMRREKALFERGRLLNIGFRTYNEVKIGLVAVGDELGHGFNRIFHEVALSPHGWMHMRGIEDGIIPLLRNSFEIPMKWKSCLLAAGCSPFHDIHQAFMEMLNHDDNLNLNPKAGHMPLSAVMFACFGKDMIKKAMDVTDQQAEEIATIATYSFLCHDHNENLKVISATGSAQQPEFIGRENIDNLIKAIKEGRIDMSTLSLQQVFHWGLRQNEGNKAILDKYLKAHGKKETTWGLYPAFENQEQFKNRLVEIETNKRPLFSKFGNHYDRNSLDVVATSLAFVDQAQMVIPIGQSLARKFRVPRAEKRGYYNDRSKMFTPENLQKLHEDMVESDVDRNIYELLKLYDLVDSSVLRHSQYARKIVRLNVMFGLKYLEKFSEEFMKGKFAPVNAIFDNSANRIKNKVKRKFGLNRIGEHLLDDFLLSGGRKRSIERILDGLSQSEAVALKTALKAIEQIRHEEKLVRSSILKKPENLQKLKPKRYTEKTRQKAKNDIRSVQAYFLRKAGLTLPELRACYRYIRLGSEPPFFADSIQSVGSLIHAKTMSKEAWLTIIPDVN